MKFLLLIIVTARLHCLIVLKVMGNKESYYVGLKGQDGTPIYPVL